MSVRKRAANRAKCGYNRHNSIELRFADGISRVERAEMNELKTLEDRLKLATDRISAALSAKNDHKMQLEAVTATNADLHQQIQEIRSDRAGDLAEINTLIEQIRPLMEGNEDA